MTTSSAGESGDREVYVFPASHAQSRLWLIEKLQPGTGTYNIPFALRIQGALDEDAFERAVQEILARHEALRTRFEDEDGDVLQVVYPPEPVRMDRYDARHQPGEIDRVCARVVETPFDLERDTLVRPVLIRQADGEYLALIVFHHIIVDGWSIGVLSRELIELYRAYVSRQPSPLPEPSYQYVDYSEWHREWLEGEETERQLAYWRRTLGEPRPVTALPADRDRPAAPTGAGSTYDLTLSQALTRELTALAQRESATLFMALLSGLSVVLHRYAGSGDVVVGTPVANRRRPELENVVGFFVNTLALRVPIEPAMTLRDALRAVRATNLEAFEHQDVPFERVVEELRIPRQAGKNPVFQVLLVLQNQPAPELELSGLRVTPVEVPTSVAKLDLALSAHEVDGGLRIHAEYSTELFDADTIERICGHLVEVLEQLVRNPDAVVSEIKMLGEAERSTVLDAWNDTAAEFPQARLVHEWIEEQVRRAPGAAAVRFRGAAMTYAELDREASRLAEVLGPLGVGPDVPVAISLDRSLDMIVGVVAILKAGGAIFPLDPAAPPARWQALVSKAGAPVVVTSTTTAPELPDHAAHTVLVDAPMTWPRSERRPSPRRIDPGNLAYVVYTSGSTGGPKGVAMSHRSHSNLLEWQIRSSSAGPGSRTLQFAALTFDVSFQEIFSTLATGGVLVVADEDTRRDGEALLQVLQSERIERFFTPVVALHNVAAIAGEQSQLDLCLREIIAAGEALRVTTDVRALLARLPGCQLVNHYGPTETHALSWWSQPPGTEPPALPPIGRALPNTRLYLLDAQMQPVPIGVAGEVYAAGEGLARGYLGRPDITASQFVPDPFGGDGGRLYRTGDLARYRGDGTLEYLGRRDEQTKIRGFRVELGEIEAALAAHPRVRACAVVVREADAGRALVGYVVGDRPPPAAAELRAWLLEQLPEYMVPAAFVALPELPLTANRKIDKAALPAPGPGDVTADPGLAPRTELELALAGIFAELLETEPASVAASFFELGGHSLLATRLVSRIRAVTGHDLPLKTVFERPTIRDLAAFIAGAKADAPSPPPIRRAARDRALPLSFAQQRLWFLDQLETGSAFYNMPFAVRLEGDLERDALAVAVKGLIERHEVLRTVLVEVDGQPQQTITAGDGMGLEHVSLDDVPASEREARALALAQRWAELPFDLARGPLARFNLCELSPADHILVVAMHHAVADGWSLPILIQELTELYTAHVEDRSPRLAELPVQYADYAVWQREWAASGGLKAQVAYWRRALGGELPVLELPRDRPRPARQRYRGHVVTRELPANVAATLDSAFQRTGATPFMTLLAGFSALLHRLTSQDDIVVGTPISGRRAEQVEGLIGCFVNTLVVRSRVGANETFADLLGQVKATALEAFANQDVPFEQLVEILQPKRSTQHTPIFQAMFVYNEQASEVERIGSARVSSVDVETATSTFDLTVTVTNVAGRLSLAAEYDTDLFDQDSVEHWMAAYQELLTSALGAPEQHVSELPMLDRPSRVRVLESFGAGGGALPEGRCLGELFEVQAAECPEATAVELGDERLTYRELCDRSTRLASHLRDLGIGAEVTVGVCLERSLDMIVAIFAIIRAGGAYVPLDPALPSERMAYMLGDARARVLISHSRLETTLPTGPWTLELIDRRAQPRRSAADAGEKPVALAPAPLTPDNLAYVIYTSGSTGKPKGVMVAHRQAHARLAFGQAAYPLGPGCRVLQVASLSFDPSVLEIFTTLTTGATLVLLSPGAQRDPAKLAQHITEKRITSLELVPSMLDLVLEEGAFDPGSTVQRVYVGGEAISVDIMHRFLERSEAELHNTYGPTEATVDVIHWPCRVHAGLRSVPIGRPIAASYAYILDVNMQPVPIGVPGELFLGGIYLARGYQGRPDITADRFVPDPFGAPGARLYRTGDLVRHRADGNIEFLGRTDHQVKVRGVRIELGEIEALLRTHDTVQDCAVVTHEVSAGDTRLVGYCAVKQPVSPDQRGGWADSIRTHLLAELPPYMVPAHLVPMDALPYTASNKVDRKKLPAPAQLHRAPAPQPSSSDPLESGVLAIAREILAVDRVELDDDFFRLGGHSMLAVRFMAQIQRQLGIKLSLDYLFEAPSFAALIQHVRSATREASASPVVLLRQGAGQPPAFWIHPVGGGILCYRTIVGRLAGDRPHFGIGSPGLQGQERPDGLVELARSYVQNVVDACPEGPVALIGWSFGGLVAYEMARQLDAWGRRVEPLVLIDAAPEDGHADEASMDAELAELLQLELTHGLAPAERHLVLRELRRNLRAAHHYEARPYDREVVVIEADNEGGSAVEGGSLEARWRPLAVGRLAHHRLGGDHYQILEEPHVDALAAVIQAALDGERS